MGKMETQPQSEGMGKAQSARAQGSCIASPLSSRAMNSSAATVTAAAALCHQEAGSELTVPLQGLTDIGAQLPSGAAKGERPWSHPLLPLT